MSNATRNYLTDFDYRAFSHTASASQMEAFLTCPRKWWFSKVAKLPELMDQTKFVFGDVLHEVCERWLGADDQGRDADGKPVDLYPEGWSKTLSDFDASIVKRLVEAGIEKGVLRRTPGRRIEAPIGIWDARKKKHTPLQLAPGVGLAGYRDVKAPGLVEDHKSVKTRNYMKSQAAILADPQMLLYGGVELIEAHLTGEPIPEEVTLRQNQFVKDPDDLYVRPCEVQASREVLQQFWEEVVQPAAAEMLRYKQTGKSTKWDEVEGPRQKGACAKYGGCPFAKICSRVETPDGYRARIARINEIPSEDDIPTITITNPQESKTMGIFDRVKASPQAAPAGDAGTPTTSAPKHAAAKADPAESSVTSGDPGVLKDAVKATAPAEGVVSQGPPEAQPKAETAAPESLVAEEKVYEEVEPPEASPLEALMATWDALDALDWGQAASVTKAKKAAKAAGQEHLDLFLAFKAAVEGDGDVPPRPGSVGLPDIPPWAYDGCRACGGIGFNSKGSPCAACDRRATKFGTVPSKKFDILIGEDGVAFWSRDGEIEGRRALQAAEVQAAEKVNPPAPSVEEKAASRRGRLAKIAESEPDSVEEPKSVEDSAGADAVAAAVAAKPGKAVKPTSAKSTGRGKGFLMVYGSVRRAKMTVVNLNDLFGTYAHELAETQGARSYYDLDRFKRGDLMASMAERVAETIPNNTIVVVRPDDQDIRKFAMALERFASNVIEGLS